MAGQIRKKQEIYEVLKSGELSRAEELTLEALEDDISDEDLEDLLKVIKFWQNRSELFSFSTEKDNGTALFDEWDRFLDFCVDNQIDNKRSFFALKAFVFRNVVDLLVESYKLSPIRDKDVLITLGQAFYEIGMLDKAIETLEYALDVFGEEEDIRAYVLLGDIYSVLEQSDLSMVMFNEAFFRFPQLVNLDTVQYAPIQKLRKMVVEDGFADNEIVEWIPIYGYIYSGLTARRKLEYEDYQKLIRLIKEYEKSLVVDKTVVNIIIPRLINYYLWVFDYYLYQVKAIKGARKIIERVRDLLEAAPCQPETKDKLTERADILFKKLLNNSWDIAVTKDIDKELMEENS